MLACTFLFTQLILLCCTRNILQPIAQLYSKRWQSHPMHPMHDILVKSLLQHQFICAFSLSCLDWYIYTKDSMSPGQLSLWPLWIGWAAPSNRHAHLRTFLTGTTNDATLCSYIYLLMNSTQEWGRTACTKRWANMHVWCPWGGWWFTNIMHMYIMSGSDIRIIYNNGVVQVRYIV